MILSFNPQKSFPRNEFPSNSPANQSLNLLNPSVIVSFHHFSVTSPVPTTAAPTPATISVTAGTADLRESVGSSEAEAATLGKTSVAFLCATSAAFLSSTELLTCALSEVRSANVPARTRL